jgi:hypothetical protein
MSTSVVKRGWGNWLLLGASLFLMILSVNDFYEYFGYLQNNDFVFDDQFWQIFMNACILVVVCFVVSEAFIEFRKTTYRYIQKIKIFFLLLSALAFLLRLAV